MSTNNLMFRSRDVPASPPIAIIIICVTTIPVGLICLLLFAGMFIEVYRKNQNERASQNARIVYEPIVPQAHEGMVVSHLQPPAVVNVVIQVGSPCRAPEILPPIQRDQRNESGLLVQIGHALNPPIQPSECPSDGTHLTTRSSADATGRSRYSFV